MAKFKVRLDTKVTVTADGKVRFSGAFREGIIAAAKKCMPKSCTVQFVEVSSQDDSHVSFLVRMEPGATGDTISSVISQFEHSLTMMTEHGRDVDILEMLLDRHPELKTHPRLNELIGNFDMLSAKVQELEGDKKSKPSQTTPELPKPGKPMKMSKAELAQHREEKLKGQAPDQLQKAVASTGESIRNIITPPEVANNGPVANIFVPDGGKHGTNT